MSRGKFKNAILAFEDARSKGWNEKPGKLELLIGISYVELEDFEAAKKELTLALETDESDQADMWLNYIKNVEDSMKFLQTFSGWKNLYKVCKVNFTCNSIWSNLSIIIYKTFCYEKNLTKSFVICFFKH